MGEKIKNLLKKDKKLLVIFVLAVIGIIFLLISEIIPDEEKSEDIKEFYTSEKYAQTVEEKLSSLISSIEGAGKTEVMVTLDTSEENVYAKQVKSDKENNDNKNSAKYEYEYIIIKSDSSGEEGMLLKVIEPDIRGVAIVCDGGDNPTVRENIISAVSAVLDIKTNNISICKRKS